MNRDLIEYVAETLRAESDDPRRAVESMPGVLIGLQAVSKSPRAAQARTEPERFAFACAASALGFAGESLPGLFAAHASAHAAGAAIRRRYDEIGRGK